eukprot:11989680-Alexandrium_andersonii.AAC.1
MALCKLSTERSQRGTNLNGNRMLRKWGKCSMEAPGSAMKAAKLASFESPSNTLVVRGWCPG